MLPAHLHRYLTLQGRRSGADRIESPAVGHSVDGYATRVHAPCADLLKFESSGHRLDFGAELWMHVNFITRSELKAPAVGSTRRIQRAGMMKCCSDHRESAFGLYAKRYPGTWTIYTALRRGSCSQLSYVVEAPAKHTAILGDAAGVVGAGGEGGESQVTGNRSGRDGAWKWACLKLSRGAQLTVPVGAPTMGTSLGIQSASVGTAGNERDQWRSSRDSCGSGLERSGTNAELSITAFSPAQRGTLSGVTCVLAAERQGHLRISRRRCGNVTAVAASSADNDQHSKSGMRESSKHLSVRNRGVRLQRPGDASHSARRTETEPGILPYCVA
jgi:hypothetical protein